MKKTKKYDIICPHIGVGIMKEITLKESDISRMKKYPLDGILNTESEIYYYKKDPNWNNSYLLKRLFCTDENRVCRKIRTIEELQRSELSTYPELILPEEVVTIQGIQSGFTIKEVTDCINLHIFLEDKKISNEDKLLVLKKIGKLLRKVQASNQEFYFGDLQEYNFLVDENKDIFVVDLDSSAITRKTPLESNYIVIDKKTHPITKYKVNKVGRCYPNSDIDTFCYNTLVMNYLSGTKLHRLSYNEYYNYINYLNNCNLPKELIDILNNHYTDKHNESVLDYIEELPKDYGRIHYDVYKALQKQKR